MYEAQIAAPGSPNALNARKGGELKLGRNDFNGDDISPGGCTKPTKYESHLLPTGQLWLSKS